MNRTDPTRYNAPLIALHWLTLALVFLAYAASWVRDAFEHTPTEEVVQQWHTAFGLTALGLVALRLAVRAFSRAPAVVPPPPAWQATMATLVHVALYALLIALPLTGWLLTNARGHAIDWFGVALPTLAAASRPLGRTLRGIHEAIANAGYALIALHAGAALFHHYVVKDNALQRMLPALRPAQR